MNIPCPTTAANCECSDSPFANLSSEGAEGNPFIGLNWGWGWNFPKLGSNWQRNSCLGLCESLISQADADLCAAINNFICLSDTWGPPGTGNPGRPGVPLWPPPSTPLTVFYNAAQSYTVLCPDGTPFLWAINPGVIVAENQALADEIAASLAKEGAQRNQFCMGEIQPYACDELGYDQTIATTKPVDSFSIVAGVLPPGMETQVVTGSQFRIFGQPTTPGAYSFTVKASLASGAYMEKTYSISVLGIDQQALPNATTSTPYNESLSTTGGTAPYEYVIVSGALPAGLTLAVNGIISGTPTADGDFAFTVAVTDSADIPGTCQKALSLTVEPPPTDAEAWWPFEDLVIPPFIDTVHGEEMVVEAGGTGTVTQTVGKVGARALLLRPDLTHVIGTTSSPSSAHLITSNGFTITGWFRFTNFAIAGDTGAITFNIYNGVWVNGGVNPGYVLDCRFVHDPVIGTEVSFRGAGFLALLPDIPIVYAPVVGVYDFIAFGYDKALGQSFVSINNGALQYSGGFYNLALAHTTGRIGAYCGRQSAGLVSSAFDEINYFNKALTPAEIATIWNGGAGSTFP